MTLVIAWSLEDALDRLSGDPDLQPIAGGVAVLLGRAFGRPAGPRFLGIGGLEELRALTRDGDLTALGAAATLDTIARAASVPGLLATAVGATADPGIRSMGTLCGNVLAGRAASDPVAALIALRATAIVVTQTGERWVPVEDLVRDGCPPGALVRTFVVPHAQGWGWHRLTMRGAADRSVASVAVAVGSSGARVVVTWAAPRALELARTAAAIHEGATEPHAIHAAATADLDGIDLLTDDRATEVYRRRVLPVMVARAVTDAVARRLHADG